MADSLLCTYGVGLSITDPISLTIINYVPRARITRNNCNNDVRYYRSLWPPVAPTFSLGPSVTKVFSLFVPRAGDVVGRATSARNTRND